MQFSRLARNPVKSAPISENGAEERQEGEGEEGGRGPVGRQEARGEARDEPVVRETPEELRHRPRHPAQEGLVQIRQMAQVHPVAEAEGRLADQVEGAAGDQPVLLDFGQANR